MSSKDGLIFAKEALLTTSAGKQMIRQRIIQGRGYKQFIKYKERTEQEFPKFVKRLVDSLNDRIMSDVDSYNTISKFAEEMHSSDLFLNQQKIVEIKSRLSDVKVLTDRVSRILDSNFVKMTIPVLYALFEGASKYQRKNISDEISKSIIDGHIIAIDLSEPMDRVMDKDEDFDYLDDYKLLNPYILQLARENIAQGGDPVLQAFEEGFNDARIGQFVDIQLKKTPTEINDENMNKCYKKYRAVMGTAGRNMALNQRPLSEIFSLGMAKASECVGCGNEIEDAIKNQSLKVPSWPLYYSMTTGEVRKGFELTMKKSEIYLEDAKLALLMLPDDFELKPFLEFLFLTIQHYNQYWFRQLNSSGLYDRFQKSIDVILK